MSNKNKRSFILASVLILSFSCNKENDQSHMFETQDIHNFYEMLSQMKNATSLNDTLKILNESYIQKSSIGLKDYLKYEKRNNNRDIEQEYLKIIRSFPKYFQSQKPLLSNIENQLNEYDKYFEKLEDVYPSAKFKTTYYSIGFFNTQGQVVPQNTIFVGLEASIRTENTNYSELSGNYSWLKDEKATIKDLGYLVVHENLHTLQMMENSKSPVLDTAISEGAAVFLTEYFCGKESLVGIAGVGQDMIDYAKENKKEVWSEFGKDLKSSENFSNWFWSSNSKYPASMGYYMGYMICKSFYENQDDKQNAIEKLIEIKEPNFIFEHSQFKKFAK